MLATSGFLLASTVSRQIRSLAVADPPGLSIRRTTATTLESAKAFLRVSIMVVEPSEIAAEQAAAALAFGDLAHGVDHGDLLLAAASSPTSCRRKAASISLTKPPMPEKSVSICFFL